VADTTSDGERLDLLRSVHDVYSAKLRAAHQANRDDPRFCTGLTHAQAAMERIRRALDGVTDPVALGLQDAPEKTPEPQPDLFGVVSGG
jgi:hypothetical protein